MPVFRQSHRINAYFDRVDGLSAGNYVHISGVKVGSVKEIQLANNDSVRVSMSFDLGVDIPRGSVANLESSGLLNEKAIIIEKGTSDQMVPYDGYIEGVYEGGMMESLKNEGEKLSNNVSSSFNKLNTLLEELNSTLTEENRNRIEETLSNLEATSTDISQMVNAKRGELESSIEHANSILGNIDTLTTNNREEIDSALVRMNRSLQEVENLSKQLNQTSGRLNNILTKIENGDGSLGKLVNEPLPL
ncbi:MAG: MlaD family protein [Balneolaceae bacterium]|nr:MlaD family protein [Balneolaceae bacterium]